MPTRVLFLLRQQPIALLALFVALGGTSFAAVSHRASLPSGNVIHGCVGDNTGRLRIVDSAIRCGSLETPISFNREGRPGPQGPAGAKGDTGAAGHDGANGLDGANGHDGTDGVNALTETTDEKAGANCAAGGIKVTTGQDLDRDGKLGDAETAKGTTSYVCNGAAGASDVDFASHFATALGQKFFSGNRATTSNLHGGNENWLAQIYLTAADFPPPGTAFAAGQILPIAQNTALFSLLGTTYGGDGRTTFALPDLRDEAPNGTNYVIALQGLDPARP